MKWSHLISRLNRFFLSESFPTCTRRNSWWNSRLSQSLLPQRILSDITLLERLLYGLKSLNRFFLSESFPTRDDSTESCALAVSQSLLPQRILSDKEALEQTLTLDPVSIASSSANPFRQYAVVDEVIAALSQSLLPQRILSDSILVGIGGGQE